MKQDRKSCLPGSHSCGWCSHRKPLAKVRGSASCAIFWQDATTSLPASSQQGQQEHKEKPPCWFLKGPSAASGLQSLLSLFKLSNPVSPAGTGMLLKQLTFLFYHTWTYIALSSGKLKAPTRRALLLLGWAACEPGSCACLGVLINLWTRTWGARLNLSREGITLSDGLDQTMPVSDACYHEENSKKCARESKGNTVKWDHENVQFD